MSASELMTTKDTFQEVEGENMSCIMSYSEMLKGHLVMNPDEINRENNTDNI